MRMPEVGAVVDGCLLGRGAAEDLGFPGVEVGVEVDYADGTVGFVYGAQERERYGVVTTEGDDAREGLLLERRTNFVGVGHGGTHQEGIVTFFNLLNRVGVVVSRSFSIDFVEERRRRNVRCDRDITTVEDGSPAVEGIGIKSDIVATTESYFP